MDFNKDSKILLVGEGNFSFAVSLCITREMCQPNQIVATCFENESEIVKTAQENSKLLKDRGAAVLFNIDGRKLDDYFQTRFSHVIYNFPHCGGKMKIHENRQLLKDFFQSACKVISSEGIIITTLCSGQAGIPLDTTKRHFDDTWKLVSMATCADLILRSVTLFDASKFPGYSCFGYRSQDKGFNQGGSLMFRFSKAALITTISSCSPSYCSVDLADGCHMVPQYIYRRLQSDIFKKGSFGNFCLSYIINIFEQHFSVTLREKTIFHLSGGKKTGIVKLLLSQTYKEEGLLTVHPFVYWDKETNEVKALCAVVGAKSAESKLLQIFLKKYSLQVHNLSTSWTPELKTFYLTDLSWYTNVEMGYGISLEDQYELLKYGPVTIFFDLTSLSHILFNLQKGEFWSTTQNITSDNGIAIYQPYSMFPPVYSFHLSFWLPTRAVDLNQFHTDVTTEIMNAAENLVTSVCLLNSYTDKARRRSETYEIVYCSYDAALSKDKVKCVHFEVGKLLEVALGCEIR